MSSIDQEQASLYDGAPLQIGDEVPNFTADSHLGMITFHEVLDGQFSVLVTFPNDFEAVATTELGAMAKLKEEVRVRGGVGWGRFTHYRHVTED